MAGFATWWFTAAAVLFVLSGVAEGQDYYVGNYQTNLCPVGSEQVLSESACQEASGDLGYSYDYSFSAYSLPKGCLHWSCDGRTYHNTHPTGGINWSRAPICKTCPAGTYSATPGGPCQSCPAGHYCPEGSSSPTACLAGTFSGSVGATSHATCQVCEAVQGNYCAPGSTADDTSCAAGYFCPDTATQTACPAGTFSGSVGATSQTTCQVCEAGTYQDEAGQASCKTRSPSASPTAAPSASPTAAPSASPTITPCVSVEDEGGSCILTATCDESAVLKNCFQNTGATELPLYPFGAVFCHRPSNCVFTEPGERLTKEGWLAATSNELTCEVDGHALCSLQNGSNSVSLKISFDAALSTSIIVSVVVFGFILYVKKCTGVDMGGEAKKYFMALEFCDVVADAFTLGYADSVGDLDFDNDNGGVRRALLSVLIFSAVVWVIEMVLMYKKWELFSEWSSGVFTVYVFFNIAIEDVFTMVLYSIASTSSDGATSDAVIAAIVLSLVFLVMKGIQIYSEFKTKKPSSSEAEMTPASTRVV